MTDPMNTQQHSEATWQQLALSRIESHVSTVEYELAGLREAVNDALLQFARADESADRQAVERVRDVCDRIWDDARYAHKYGFLEVVREVRYALEGDKR